MTTAKSRAEIGKSWDMDSDKPFFHVMPRDGWLNGADVLFSELESLIYTFILMRLIQMLVQILMARSSTRDDTTCKPALASQAKVIEYMERTHRKSHGYVICPV